MQDYLNCRRWVIGKTSVFWNQNVYLTSFIATLPAGRQVLSFRSTDYPERSEGHSCTSRILFNNESSCRLRLLRSYSIKKAKGFYLDDLAMTKILWNGEGDSNSQSLRHCEAWQWDICNKSSHDAKPKQTNPQRRLIKNKHYLRFYETIGWMGLHDVQSKSFYIVCRSYVQYCITGLWA